MLCMPLQGRINMGGAVKEVVSSVAPVVGFCLGGPVGAAIGGAIGGGIRGGGKGALIGGITGGLGGYGGQLFGGALAGGTAKLGLGMVSSSVASGIGGIVGAGLGGMYAGKTIQQIEQMKKAQQQSQQLQNQLQNQLQALSSSSTLKVAAEEVKKVEKAFKEAEVENIYSAPLQTIAEQLQFFSQRNADYGQRRFSIDLGGTEPVVMGRQSRRKSVGSRS